MIGPEAHNDIVHYPLNFMYHSIMDSTLEKQIQAGLPSATYST